MEVTITQLLWTLVAGWCLLGVGLGLVWWFLRQQLARFHVHYDQMHQSLVSKHDALHETTKHVAARQQFGVRGPVK